MPGRRAIDDDHPRRGRGDPHAGNRDVQRLAIYTGLDVHPDCCGHPGGLGFASPIDLIPVSFVMTRRLMVGDSVGSPENGSTTPTAPSTGKVARLPVINCCLCAGYSGMLIP